MAFGLASYDDSSRREDLLDIFAGLTPEEKTLTEGNISRIADEYKKREEARLLREQLDKLL